MSTQQPLPNMPPTPPKTGSRQQKPPKFPDFTTFVQRWLLPVTSVRLAESSREGTYTWCTEWWRHRGVAVRFAHLHRGFEAARRSGTISAYLLEQVDPHLRAILDGVNGPLHRCTRARHVTLPALSAEPVPSNHFGTATPSAAQVPQAQEGKKPPPPPRFGDFVDFVERWLLPVTAVRIVGRNREGTYTWCRYWWEHEAVVIRFAALHRMFEAARVSEDEAMMSKLFVKHIDPHFRVVLDAAKGPLYACTPDQHVVTPSLSGSTPSGSWFDRADPTAVEELGFGPDFRPLATPPAS